jgi:hypothetical protein
MTDLFEAANWFRQDVGTLVSENPNACRKLPCFEVDLLLVLRGLRRPLSVVDDENLHGAFLRFQLQTQLILNGR